MCFSFGWTLHAQFEGIFYNYQLYFGFANLLNISDFISLSFLDGGGPSRNKSTYEIVLFLIQSFSGRRCSDNPLIFSQNDKNFKYFDYQTTTFTSYLSFIALYSSKSAFFSGTSARLLSLLADYFCSSYILHLHACVNCENKIIL